MALSFYLDASVVVSLFVPDSLTSRADALLRDILPNVLISDLVELEFASVVSRRVRQGERSKSDALAVFAEFETWAARAIRVRIEPADVVTATSVVRGMNTALRTADAIHVAAARRLGATLATFDEKMASGAQYLGVSVTPGR